MRSLGFLLLCSSLSALGCDSQVELPPDDGAGGDPAPDDASDDDDEDAPDDNDAEAPDGDGDDPGTTGAGANVDPEPEPEDRGCEEWSASRACTDAAGTAGMEFCDYFEGGLAWGACLTEYECVPGESREASWCDDDSEDNFECDACGSTESCTLWGDGTPGWEGCDTPLVLSFDGRAPELEPAPAAAFDVSGTGQCLSHDWPTSDTPWLALDVDGSGAIESGRELFGSGTRLRGGRRAEHGFAALAELDSDGDGRITPADARFAELVLWADHDADKRSTPAELEPLAMHGVIAIELSYRRDALCDARGNCGIERASFVMQRGETTRHGEVVDVHLSCQ
jgi:hypothetical protein